MMTSLVNPTRLRENLYGILDEVLTTGTPVSIERKGRLLTLSAQPSGSRMARLVAHPGSIVGDPEALVSIDWSSEWKPGL
ncbi:MAG: hypothetical protein WCG80_19060 [Spirochaetales bacterium]